MTIYHIVLFKLSPNLTKSEVDLFYSGLESLKSIEGVVAINYGAIDDKFYSGYNSRALGYTHGLQVTLRDAVALEFYDKHSFHQKVKETAIFPYLDKSKDQTILAIDFIDLAPQRKSVFNNIYVMSSVLALGIAVLFPIIRSRL